MFRISTGLVVLILLLVPAVCLAGLGKPLPAQDKAAGDKAIEAARSNLQKRGYSQEQVDAAIAKIGPERLSLLDQEVEQTKAGGYFLEFLIFILVVAVVVVIVIYLLEEERRRYHQYRR